MSRIKLEFGRPVIAGETDIMAGETDIKGTYIHKSSGNAHAVLCDDNVIRWFDNVKPDPDGAPMNGDRVQCNNDSNGLWSNDFVIYVGRVPTGHLVMTSTGSIIQVEYVRHPQPSKRERVRDALNKYTASTTFEELADEILKICEVNE